MTILVLGGAGYIGSHTVYELIAKGEDVVYIHKQDFTKVISETRVFWMLYLIKKK